jgi:predicted RNase H-like HicB family nuclease
LISEEASADLEEITDYFLNVSVEAGDRFVNPNNFKSPSDRLNRIEHDILGNSSETIAMSSFSILLESNPNGNFQVTILGLPDCHAHGITREDALTNAKQALTDRLSTAELVSIAIPTVSTAQQMAGRFIDDPHWDEFQAAIGDYRQTLDAELAEEYRQMDKAEQPLNLGQSAA